VTNHFKYKVKRPPNRNSTTNNNNRKKNQSYVETQLTTQGNIVLLEETKSECLSSYFNDEFTIYEL